MARITGLGGVFLRMQDVALIRKWYADVLGMKMEDWGGAKFDGPQSRYGVLGLFEADTDYFAPSTAMVMINLIVDDLDGVLAAAAAHGVKPLEREDNDPNGRFAWLLDPAGVKVELWQPAEAG